MARIQTTAPAHAEARGFVFVVADEDEGRAAYESLIVGFQAHGEQRVAAHHGNQRDNECRPLAHSLPLLALAHAHQLRVDAEARIVDEDVTVDFANIYMGGAAR